MKSSFFLRCLFAVQWYLILFLILNLLGQTSSGVVPSSNVASLYTSNDKVVILAAQNITSIVYNSKTAWLVEFYASWCGHCQSYANTYREVAIDTIGWKTVVRIGAINCYAEDNQATCEEHNILGFPTLRLIPPETSFGSKQQKSLIATNSRDVERELIKELDAVNRTDKSWPHFTPFNGGSLDDLYQRISSSVKLVLMIVEKHDDFTGRQIMLDFSKYYEQLAIFRTTPEGTLWQIFRINVTDIPALFIVYPNRTIEQMDTKQQTNATIGSRNAFNYAIRSYIHQKNSIDNFDDQDLEEIIASRNALREAEQKEIIRRNQTNSTKDDEVIQMKVNMFDIETALSYMLRGEIPRTKQIQGETYDALVNWLSMLAKYFPGREPVMNYLNDLSSKMKEYPKGLTGKQFRELADYNIPTSYLPRNQIRYHFCEGSSPRYRGYPCALWLLFHTLTVAQAESVPTRIEIIEMLLAIKNFIKYFFSCRHCSDNFMRETSDMDQINSNDPNAAMVYIWKIHNHVNQRLHGGETEDPDYPKVQFPPTNLCTNCQSITHDPAQSFELNKIVEFLQGHYSRENFYLGLVEDFSPSNDKQLDFNQKQAYMIELNEDSTSKFGIFTRIIHQFPFYFLISVVLLIFFIRRKYWKDQNEQDLGDVKRKDASMLMKFSRRITWYIKRAIMGSTYFLKDEQEIHRRSGIAGASYNLINSIVGSGVIGMSYAFRQSGYLAGFVLLVLVAILTDYSTTILLRSGQMVKVTTYQELVYTVLGKSGFLWLSLVQFLYPFICLVSYNIIIGDTVTKVLHRLWPTIPYVFQNRYTIIFLCSCFVTLPLSFYRNIAKLSQISLIGLLLVLITVFILIKRGYDTVSFISPEIRDLRLVNTNISESIGVMAFAFMCQHNSFLIFHSMQEKSLSRWRIVTLITTTVAFLFAVTYALTGYVVFGQQTEGDLLESYCHWDTLINIARLIYAINIMLTFPLECLVCRQVLEIVCSQWIHFNSIRRHYILTIFIVTASVILSLTTDCLGIVLELNGLLIASPLAYILPALCYLKLQSNPFETSFDNLRAYALLIIGILLTASGFVLPLRHVLQEGYYCQHGIEPQYCSNMFPTIFNSSTIRAR